MGRDGACQGVNGALLELLGVVVPLGCLWMLEVQTLQRLVVLVAT